MESESDLFSLDEKYILRYAVEDLIDKDNINLGYSVEEIKTVWNKVLKLIDNHNNLITIT